MSISSSPEKHNGPLLLYCFLCSVFMYWQSLKNISPHRKLDSRAGAPTFAVSLISVFYVQGIISERCIQSCKLQCCNSRGRQVYRISAN